MFGLSFHAQRRRLRTACASLLLASSLLVGVTACNDDEDEPAAQGPAPTVKLNSNATLGSHLVDGQGNTLYYFARDLNGANNCTGGCASVWPAFHASNLVLGEGLKAEDFTTITTADGKSQTAYKGWPLYYYAPADANGQNVREQPGETKGENVGSVWFVLKPDYSVLLTRTAVTNKTTNQSSVKTFLVDGQGRTLYTFGRDQTNPESQPTNCSGNCATVWPVYFEAGRSLPSSLKSSDFGVITRPDGANGATRQQTTYKGLPLYYFATDANTRGKAEGDGVGNIWSVATP